MKQKLKSLLRSPERISIMGFILLIAAGTGLLMLPLSAAGNRIGFIDALFTSTSASCVTGLAVVDTGKDFSLFGQLVLLLLIQAGGMGIMTLSTFFILISGRRPGLTERAVIKDTFTHSGVESLSSILRDIFLFAFVIEGLGMIVMFFCFIPEKGLGEALHLSFFHAVSAFCNAGFSPFSDSFMGYCEHWILNLTLCFLIICGGMGFLVLSELKRSFLSFPSRSLETRKLRGKKLLTSHFSVGNGHG